MVVMREIRLEIRNSRTTLAFRRRCRNSGAVVDLKDYQIVAGPDIVSRGFVYMHESQELIKAANHEVFWAILNTFKNHKHVDQRVLNRTIISRLQELLYDRTGRRPVIIPMVTILNGNNRSENQHYRRPNNKIIKHIKANDKIIIPIGNLSNILKEEW